ncbi:EF-hand domain-containing protein [Kordiimonas laminariae]|uniref:EF-hand domain-containing protein n=1 Tax=Kordiimonas laminariae TaxID=2917717 RepID=UPI001FF45110|nr:EF-hand domain-containing protein [Kordiimonas laminariae]MCK0069449.1 EF-hand domain-containing protein [Kordiimonas laminariae]
MKLVRDLLLASLAFGFAAQTVAADDVLEFLDGDRDGTISAYEAMDQLLRLQKETGKKQLSIADFKKYLANLKADEEAELKEMMASLDANGNGKLTVKELKKAVGDLARGVDRNGDKTVSLQELQAFDLANAIVVSDSEIRDEVAYIMEALDENGNGALTKREMPEAEIWDDLKDKDLNRDGSITRKELITAAKQDNKIAEFDVQGSTAVMTGTISASTPARVLELVIEHPEVTTILLGRVPGSVDDEANLRAASYVRQFGLNTKLASNSVVASGGTDFFLAGVERSVSPGAMAGVHSWGGPGYEGKDVPRDDEQHQSYLEYYREMGIPAKFYWFTLEAAPVEGVHWMTSAEFKKYKFATSQK